MSEAKTHQGVRQNIKVPGIVRDEVRDGTTFLVVPVVMLQEQILFCSNCHPKGEFISAQEIMSSLVAWDNRPITLSHPNQEWNPGNHQRLEVGRIFNTFWDGKLKAEMWLDLTVLKSSMKGREAESRFRSGEVTEVSTGYFVDRIQARGKFQGSSFELRQVGIIPDHLAILTDEIGACSIAGGCGAPRLNSEPEDSMDDKSITERLGLGIKALLALGSAVGGGSDDGDDKSGGPGKNDKGKEASMERKELIALLLKDEKVEFSAEELGKMKDGQLKSLATLAGCGGSDNAEAEAKKKAEAAEKEKADAEAKKLADAEAKKKAEAKGDDEGKKPAKDDAPTISAEDQKFLTALRAAGGDSVDGLVALMEAGKVEAERRKTLKAELVAQLHKDDRCAMSEALLNTMSLEALEGMDRSINPSSYAGKGGARLESRGGDDIFADDPPPVMLAELTDDEKKGGA